MIANQTCLIDIETVVEAVVPKGFRRLKRDEVVAHGDYMVDERRGFQPWEGPGGFHARAFLRPVYRQKKSVPPEPSAN